MVKRNNVMLPSGQGGLVGGLTTSFHSKIQLSPKLIIYFALACTVFIWLLFNI